MDELETPPTYNVARPRYFGLAPRGLVIALAGVAVAAAVASFVFGQAVAGVLLLLAAAFLGALVLDVAPGLAHTRSFAGFAGRSTRAWAGAARDVARLRLEQRAVNRDRERLLRELGVAVFAGDEQRAEALTGELRVCTDRDAACRIELEEALERARKRTSDERFAVAKTRVMGDPGFEPGTSALSERRSNQLS